MPSHSVQRRRPIKFRALDRATGRWEVLSVYELANGESSKWADVDMETLGEFTGLLDRNGKEIWEGDVLHLQYETVHLTGKVIPAEDGHWIIFQDSENYVGVHHNRDRIEIIGNIYKNPELA